MKLVVLLGFLCAGCGSAPGVGSDSDPVVTVTQVNLHGTDKPDIVTVMMKSSDLARQFDPASQKPSARQDTNQESNHVGELSQGLTAIACAGGMGIMDSPVGTVPRTNTLCFSGTGDLDLDSVAFGGSDWATHLTTTSTSVYPHGSDGYVTDTADDPLAHTTFTNVSLSYDYPGAYYPAVVHLN